MIVNITKEQAVNLLGIKSFDYALPQTWLNDFQSVIDSSNLPELKGFNALSNFVWSYEENSNYGSPRPLTLSGLIALDYYNEKCGTSYNVECKVIDSE